MEFTARAKAFSSEGVREHRFLVDGATVRVWDNVAGHYTTCHSLGESAIRRLRKIAEEKEMYSDKGYPRADGPRCATCGDLIAWGEHPMCARKHGRLIRQ